MATIDITPLAKAVKQLQSGIGASDAEPDREIIRDGAIQRFEYCFELAIKSIKRVLETQFADPVDQLTYKDLLRTAVERGLIDDVEKWFSFREERNRTAHTYDENTAAIVFQSAKNFLPAVSLLLKNLERILH